MSRRRLLGRAATAAAMPLLGPFTSALAHAATRRDLRFRALWHDFAEVRELSRAEQNRALCASELDAIVYSVGHPNGLIRAATLACHGMLVAVSGPAIDRMLSKYQEYERAMIPGGTYPVNPMDVHTFGVRAVVVTTARISDAVAYEITRAVFDNFDDFRRLHPAFEALSVAGMAHDAGGRAPVHAARYYREHGWLPCAPPSFGSRLGRPVRSAPSDKPED